MMSFWEAAQRKMADIKRKKSATATTAIAKPKKYSTTAKITI